MTAVRRRLRPRLVAALALVVALPAGGWLWLRDSSLVAVTRVTVQGAAGADSGAVRAALIAAARSMTTLDLDTGQLHIAVQPYPEVRALNVSTQFPHGLRIEVVEQSPVAVVTVAGRRIAVAADGTLLRSSAGTASLPEIPLGVPPGGRRLTGGAARDVVTILAGAPWQLLKRLGQVTTQASHGVVAQLRNGPAVYFGDSRQVAAKWQALIAVLADPGSDGAAYVDVSDPQRPVAGAGGTAAATTSTGSGVSAATGSSPTAPGGG